jgi:hypothetical protein
LLELRVLLLILLPHETDLAHREKNAGLRTDPSPLED